MNTLKRQLTSLYDREGISPASFRDFGCEHKAKCRKAASKAGGGDPFVCGRGAAISAGYERTNIPRVLILSADWGGDRKNRSSEREIRRVGPATSRKLQQYREEQEIAAAVLRKYLPDLKDWKGVHKFYTRTNSVKCCANLPNAKQAPAEMFSNCRQHLRKEIALLAPHVLITQGEKAETVVKEELDGVVRILQRWRSRDRDGKPGNRPFS